MKSIVTLIVPSLQHDPDPEPPHYPPLLCKDTHLEMVLHHHIAHHNNHLVLHLEEDLVTLLSPVDHPLNPLTEILFLRKLIT